MAGYKGRKVLFTWNGAVIPGVREKGITLNGEPVDLTSDDDNGWRQLMEDNGPAQKQVDVSLSGVTKSSTLKDNWFAGDQVGEVVITYPDGSSISGTFYLNNYSEGNPYNDAATFEASLQSSGEVIREAYN